MIDWLACALVRVLGGLIALLPPSVAVWVGERLGALAYWLQPKRTRIGVRNLRAAFDGTLTVEQARRTIRACYRQIGAGFMEMVRLPRIDRAYVDRYVTLDGYRHVETAVASGKPVIFLTGHYGNWELAAIAGALLGHPMVALARVQQRLPRLYRLLVSYRESKGCRVIHQGNAMKHLLAALAQRQPVGIVADQASRQGVFVNFFGRPALFALGPFELAYRKDALILPVMMRRIRGPFHRLVIEPPMTLSRHVPRALAVREGAQRFAALLARHIAADPGQWLWMHKRWKRTPARRALVLSDGKAGHVKQSLALVSALRERCPALSHDVVEVRYRSRLRRAAALLWSWWMPSGAGETRCLRWTLTRASQGRLLTRYADLVISCGASLAPVNLLWARVNGARSVVVMNPAPLPLGRFSLVVAPRHDALPRRPNVVCTDGAVVHRMPEAALREARERLQAQLGGGVLAAAVGAPEPPAPPGRNGQAIRAPHRPTVAVFLGGDTAAYRLGPSFAEALMAQVRRACDAVAGAYVLTTSRRTSGSVERWLNEHLRSDARCAFLLLANRRPVEGGMEGLLGWGDAALVSGESISMVSEACASGRPVVVVEPPLRPGRRRTVAKHRRFLRQLAQQQYARVVPVGEIGRALQDALEAPGRTRPLDPCAMVGEALARLL